MKALDLAGRGWRSRLGQQVLDAVEAADPIEEHLHRGMGMYLPVNTLPLSVNTCSGTPYACSAAVKPSQTSCGPLAGHEPRRDAEPRVVIDAGQRLGGGAVGQQETTHDVHLPELHGLAALPALPGLLAPVTRDRLDHPGPDQAAVHRRLPTVPAQPVAGAIRAAVVVRPSIDASGAARAPSPRLRQASGVGRSPACASDRPALPDLLPHIAPASGAPCADPLATGKPRRRRSVPRR